MKNVLILTTLLNASIIESTANLFLAFPLSNVNVNPRITGGNPAKRHEFPWIVSIQFRHEDDWKHDCGGAIIDTNHIVTAGHCVWNRNIDEIQVVAGVHNMDKEEKSQQRRNVEKIYLHPNYTTGDGAGPFDIAIMSLTYPFNFNKAVRSIKVAKCGEEPEEGQECVYAGWGNLFPISPLYYQGSDVLIKEPTTVISLDECKEAYSMYADALATALCSRSGVLHGTCQGDSGGPLVCFRGEKKHKPYLAGVVSFGFPVCNDGYHPDVYTSLGNTQICDYFFNYDPTAVPEDPTLDDSR